MGPNNCLLMPKGVFTVVHGGKRERAEGSDWTENKYFFFTVGTVKHRKQAVQRGGVVSIPRDFQDMSRLNAE